MKKLMTAALVATIQFLAVAANAYGTQQTVTYDCGDLPDVAGDYGVNLTAITSGNDLIGLELNVDRTPYTWEGEAQQDERGQYLFVRYNAYGVSQRLWGSLYLTSGMPGFDKNVVVTLDSGGFSPRIQKFNCQ